MASAPGTPDSAQRESFVRLLSTHHNALQGFILTLFPDVDRAADVLQETHVEMWRKADQFEPGTNFLGWACQIARYKVMEARAAQSRDRLVFDDELLGQMAAEAEDYESSSSDHALALESCLDTLPAGQRELITRRYEPGASVQEMAEELDRPARSLSVTMHRIRKALVECVERKLTGSDSS